MEKKWTFSTVWKFYFQLEYLQSISRIFPYHGELVHTVEFNKTMEIGFSNPFLQLISKIFTNYGIGPLFPVHFLFRMTGMTVMTVMTGMTSIR